MCSFLWLRTWSFESQPVEIRQDAAEPVLSSKRERDQDGDQPVAKQRK